jgi:hypothetical protein
MKKLFTAVVLVLSIIVSVQAVQPLNDYHRLNDNQKKLMDKVISFSNNNAVIVNVRKNDPKNKQLAFVIKNGNSNEIKKVTYIYLINTKSDYSVTKDIKEKESYVAAENHRILKASCKNDSVIYNSIIKNDGEVEWIYIFNHSLSNSYTITIDKKTCERAKKIFKDIK